MAQDIDTIDARILDIIQHDASLSVADIADRVGLSSSPCWRRIKRMEEAGFITGRVTLLDNFALGLNFEVMASVKLAAGPGQRPAEILLNLPVSALRRGALAGSPRPGRRKWRAG